MTNLRQRTLAALTSAALAFGALDITGAQATGFAALTVSKPVYQLGEKVRTCFTLPAAGKLTITETDETTGESHVLLSRDDDGATDCVAGILGGDPGRVCEKLDYETERGSGSLKTCYDVTREAAPPPQPKADSPVISVSPESGPPGTKLVIDGAGFQEFVNNPNGIGVIVTDWTGLKPVDWTEMPPTLEGNLRLVLDTANYPAGQYMVSTAYSVRALTSLGVTYTISDPVYFTISPP